MAELTKLQLQALQFNTEVATASAVSDFVNASTTELSSSLIARIQALEGFSTFIGVKDALPESAENGQIVIVGEKEYIWGPKADGVAGWTELGDTTAEAAAIEELSTLLVGTDGTGGSMDCVVGKVEYLNGTLEVAFNEIHEVSATLSTIYEEKADVSDVESLHTSLSSLSVDVYTNVAGDIQTLKSAISTLEDDVATAESNAKQYTEEKLDSLSSTFGDIVTHNVSEFDLSGSAAAAQEAAISAAKAYTDEQIAAVEGEISSLTDVVETKADQTAVDAAISAINDSISTLSAKAEEDPVFTAWKDSDNVLAGSDTTINGEGAYGGVGIGLNCTTAEKGVAIGAYAEASMNSISFGESAKASGGNDNIAIGTNANASMGLDIAIGSEAQATGWRSIAIGNGAQAKVGDAVQIGPGENIYGDSLQFRNTQIVDSFGKITTANLAGMSDLQDALNNVAEVTESDDIAKLRATVNALAAAIKAFAGL